MSKNEKLLLFGIAMYLVFGLNQEKKPTNWKELILIDKVKKNQTEFGQEVIEIAEVLDVNPNWLMFVMYFESSLNHKAENSNGCTGLIQFCDEARSDLGITKQQLKNMTNVQQLEYVERYFTQFHKERLKSVRNAADLYLIVFFPLASGKADSFILQTSKISAQTIYNQNPFFQDGSGVITVGTVKKKINEFIKSVS